MTITCWECQREHALFYYVNANGYKVLCIRCDRYQRLVKNRTNPEMESVLKTSNRILSVPPNLTPAKLIGTIPEKWSRPWVNKMQGQKQGQLVLMK